MSQEEAPSVIAAKARASDKQMTDSELDQVTGGIISYIGASNPNRRPIQPDL